MTAEEMNRIDQCRHLLPDPAPCSAPSGLWKAVAQVIADEGKPLEVWRVAKATGQTEEQIISALIRESSRNGAVTFRYPPLPCAAIIRIELPNTSEQARL